MESTLGTFEMRVASLEQEVATMTTILRELVATLEEKEGDSQNIIGNLEDCSQWIKRSPSTIYKMTSQNRIPHYKNGKLLLFKKADVLAWLEKDKQLTIDEHNSLVDQELQRHPNSPWKG